ncbi:MAG: ATP-grasp domain-containing protein, partial [Anaerolineales bacterium]|nr:ATP-grasp domain-containing protein [Anaerolineales bacterium]
MITLHTDHVTTVVLLATPNTYRSLPFAAAAKKIGLKVHWGVDLPEPLSSEWNIALPIDLRDSAKSVRTLMNLAEHEPVAAVIALDDAASVVAAQASAQLGLPHNSPAAALAARDKLIMRERMRVNGVLCPSFSAFPLDADPTVIAAQISYPCILKPLLLNGSRGVIRANNTVEFETAWKRISTILHKSVGKHILVEDYIPGKEFAVEALLSEDGLRVLALFDKPDPLDGPFFEETIYVTPSRLNANEQDKILSATNETA